MVQVGDRLRWAGELVEVLAVLADHGDRFDVILQGAEPRPIRTTLSGAELEAARQPANDGRGHSAGAIAALWGLWMDWATPRIRAAATATKPIRPYAHQDEAVFQHMLPQPRLRFLLADEPGTGKTAMSAMYLVEGRRRRVVTGKVLIVPPAHLVSKWIADLDRLFGVDAERLDAATARSPRTLRDDVDVWVVSVDLLAHNPDVLAKVAGPGASWSLAIFDEAHRLTPTSQYLGAARLVGERSHHLLLLTATPHRGKEWYFQSLLNLLDADMYPVTAGSGDNDPPHRMRPQPLHFLRRMKEDLADHDGTKLFKPRFAETLEVDLHGDELDCYEAVIRYVDEWYDDRAVLARSIYGKRAASSIAAAAATLQRRRASLAGPQAGATTPPAPVGFDDVNFNGAAVDDDESWSLAEDSIIQQRSRDRRGELAAVDDVLEGLQRWVTSGVEPAKWQRILDVCARHDLRPGVGQLLVFSEFTDTATWLVSLFRAAGYSTELLSGASNHSQRDELQRRFLAGGFQVLVSTDAGGEGIDLQSAHVMVDWDIPWSLVRLEQRAGRLHRIGQTEAVTVYHLVSPATREGRVQQVLLQNLDAAGEALNGRIFDLMDATAARAGFDYSAALTDAYRGVDSVVTVPTTETLVERAQELANEEDALRTPTNLAEAQARFANDRLEAVNPVMVEGFLRTVASAADWRIGPGPAERILTVSPNAGSLPDAFGGDGAALVSVDGKATMSARAAGAAIDDIITIGPTEAAFRALSQFCSTQFGPELFRGSIATDPAALTPYTLLVFGSDLQTYDGIGKTSRPLPFLIRHSANSSFVVDWVSVANLRPVAGASAARPSPGIVSSADEAAAEHVRSEEARTGEEQARWVEKARADLDAYEARFIRQLADMSEDARRAARERFLADKGRRLEDLAKAGSVTAAPPRLLGWLEVQAAGDVDDIGYDPDSEKPAVSLVARHLLTDGFQVDDRQSARLGYDLFAYHPVTREQRLVEVKGQLEGLSAVTLESNEWAQAMQRAGEYWLYVVTNCQSNPTLSVTIQDPAGALDGGPRLIERFQIPVSQLRRFAGGDPR